MGGFAFAVYSYMVACEAHARFAWLLPPTSSAAKTRGSNMASNTAIDAMPTASLMAGLTLRHEWGIFELARA
jgi:hypothetical protein